MATPTITRVTTSPSSSVFGQPVTFTAAVTSVLSGHGIPTGTVTMVISGSGGGTFTVPLNASGKATVTLSSLGTATHAVSATYNGSAQFSSSTGSFRHAVLKAATSTQVSSSPNPSQPGAPVTFTATVTAEPPGAGTPSGTVTFIVDALPSRTAQLDASGVASVTIPSLPAGSQRVIAIYHGDTNFLPSTGTGTQTVTPSRKPTTTAVTSTPDPSVFGQPVALSATVAPVPPNTGTPTGTVTFTVGGTGGGTFTAPLNASGVANVSIGTLVTGNHSITASYSGDAAFATSTGSDTHTVNRAETLTTVTSSPDPSVFGQDVAFTATVTSVAPGAGVPTGTVVFTVDGAGTFTVPLAANGTAVVTLNSLPAGTLTVTAAYGGDTDHAPSTGTDTHTVNSASTTTAVTSSPDPSVPGQEVTFSATVTAVPPGAGVPTGTVVFTINGGPVLAGTLVNGVATVTTSTLTAGPHSVTADYQGSANFAPSTGSHTHTVNGASTTTTVTSAPDPSVFGQLVTFTAVVTAVAPVTGVPTGTVTFDLGGDTATASLDANGVASVTSSTLDAGSHTVTATYNGDSNFNPSTGSKTHTVNQASTTTVAASAPDPSVFGQTVTFTATVTAVSPGAGTPTGTVTFTESGGGTATVPLDSGGVATITTDALTVGTYSGTATYNGDGDFAPSSGSDTHVVIPADTTTTVNSSPDPSVFGQSVSFTATVAPVAPGAGTPTGTVTFTVDGTTLTGALVGGIATVSIDTLTPGAHTVTATYGAASDPRFNASTGTDTHTVNQAATTTTAASAPDPSVFGQPVTFTASVTSVTPGAGTPTGTVTFALSGSGGTTTVPLNTDGTAQLTLNSLPADSYSLTATYNGDSDFATSSGTDAHTVNPASTTTIATSSPDPSAVGQAVTVTATVSPVPPGAGMPSGTVTFVITGTGGGSFTQPLDASGTAQLAIDTLALGSHNITATYNGDADFATSSATDTHTVEVEPSNTTTLTSSPDPSVFGQPVTFTATVIPSEPGPVPTGTITFTITGAGGGTFTSLLTDGTATVTLDTLSVTTHAATATYSGDTDYSASSGSDTHTVNPTDTTTSVTSSPDPTMFGQTATFTATVAAVPPGAGTPVGTVTFTIDDTTLTGTLVDGIATVSTSTLPAGNHTVQATYLGAGDPSFNTSDNTDTHTVLQAGTTTTVNSTPDPSVFGEPVTFTAVVTSNVPGAGVPTGTVTFVLDEVGVVTAPLDADGTAALPVNSLTVGSHSMTATYNGDGNFATSSGTDSHTVNAAATITSPTSNPDPTVFGQTATFTAVVAPVAPGTGTPTGIVTFTISDGPTLTGTLDATGVASVSSSTLPAGNHTVTATYNGDSSHAPSTGTDTHTVNRAATTTVLVSTPDPSVFGQEVTFTITVTPIAPGAGIPTGTVTITGDGDPVTLPLDPDGVVRGVLPTFPAGSYAATATYNGDTDFAPSAGADTQIINRASTTTVLASAPDPSVFGEDVTFTATVTPIAPGAGIPTGTVTITDSGGTSVTFPLDSSGVATGVIPAAPPGSYAATATYNGDTDFAPSTGADTQVIEPAATTTTVNSNPDPTVFGQTATFTATVAPVPPGAGTPTGTVTFTIDGTTLTGTLDATGTATVTTGTLPTGSHTVQAVYGGDFGFLASDGSDSHTVNAADTITAVNSNPDPSVFGQPVTITALVTTVAPGAGIPTGSVTFVVSGGGGTTTVPLNPDGTAQLTLNSLSAGTYSITATYGGDSGHNASSGTDSQTVQPTSTAITATSSPDPSAVGQTVTVSATVTPVPPGTGTPTGTVTFTITGTGGGTFTQTLDGNGTAQLAISTLALGSHNITATYNGDTNHLTSTGTDSQTVEVEPSNTTTLTSSPDPSVFGQPVTFTATVTPAQPGPVPTGTITFTITGAGGGTFTAPLNASGSAQLTLSTLSSTTHTATATYSGDTNYSASSGSDTQTVNPADTTTTVNSSPEPTVFGQTATFTAVVAPVAPGAGTPTGTVTFTIDGTTTLTGTVDGTGTATVSTSTLPAGSHTVQATYNGDTNYTPSTGNDTHTVNAADTTTTVNSSPDPSVFGQPVTFTATVVTVAPGAGTPTGTATFTIDGGSPTTVGLDAGGTAQFTLNSLPTGSHSVAVTYNGDGNFATSSGTDTHTVTQAPTQTSVVSTPEPTVFGQTVILATVTAPVSPGAGTPTGTVTFVVSGGPTLTATLDASGIAAVSLNTLPAGTYTITATYNGDTDFATSTGIDPHTVNRASTTTTVTSTPDPSVFGEDVTFTVAVTPNAPGAGVPTGTVTITDNSGGSDTLPLNAQGIATGTIPALAPGSYAAVATYNGDANFLPSSGSDTQVVNRAMTTTTVTSTPEPSAFGQPVTFTAVVAPVAPGAGIPTGTVTFTEAGGTVIVPLDGSGVATFTSGSLPVGTFSSTAVYNGDANFAPSTGNDTHVVNAADTTTTVNSSPDPTVFGQAATFTAVVAPVAPGAGTPVGTVTFTIDGTTTLTGTLDATGTATVSTSALPAGSHTIDGTYNGAGDPSFNTSTGTDTHTVNTASTTTTVNSTPNPSVFGQPVTFTATVVAVAPGAGTPTGTVTFALSGGGGTTTVPLNADGTAQLTLNSLPADIYSLTVSYSGDANFAPSTGTGAHTVNRASTTTTVSGTPDPSAFGQTVTVSATVTPVPPGTGTPTGTVTFTITGTGGGTFTQTLDGNGTAQLSINTLALGSHNITATYNGDTNHLTSTGTDTQTVEVEPSNTTTLTSSPDPSVFGQSVTFTATVIPSEPGPVPTGTITFSVAGAGGGTFTVPLNGSGSAQLALSTLSVATHAATATYSGDTNYSASSGADTHTVNAADTTTTVNSSPDPTVFGQTTTFTAVVAPVAPGAGTPVGTVTFTIDGTTTLTGTLSAGTATVSTSALPAGSHTVQATYNGAGDPSFNTSTGTDTHTVNTASTTTTVNSTPNPSVFGQPVTFTATVTPIAPGAGTPTGTVTFTIDGGDTTTVSVDVNGMAKLTLNPLPTGSHSVTAAYSGDGDFTGSSGASTHTVNPASTTTNVSSSPDPSSFGQTITLTATVTAVPPGTGTPTGTVTFTITGGPTLTGTLDGNGVATVNAGTLPVGNYTVTADYAGDSSFAPSTGTDTHTVNRASTTTTVSSSPDPSTLGQTVTVTATVTSNVPGAGTPTGTVTFLFDGATPVTAPLVGGVATTTTSSLSSGPHTITANYGGSSNFAPSNGTDTHTVNRGATTTTVVSSPDPSLPGRVVTFTATVSATPPATGTPTGTVTITIDGPGGGTFTAPLVNGVAKVTDQGLSIGTHAITATYNGSAQFDPSTGTDTHTVSP